MKYLKYIAVLFMTSFIACDDYLDIDPIGQIIPITVTDYRSFLTTAYATTKEHKVLSTYRGDELSLKDDALGIEQYEDVFIWNDVNPSPFVRSFAYAGFYNTVFYTNHVIDNKDIMTGEQEEIDQLVGEAYALRALQYFELVNLYAVPYNKATATTDIGVPITTHYDSDKTYPKQTVQVVYDLILSDIEASENLLTTVVQPLGFNYRFSVVAIQSFKSRVFLYQKEWQKSLDASAAALEINANLMDLNTSADMMPSEYNSVESILALETVVSFDMSNNASISDVLINSYNATTDLRFDLYFVNVKGDYKTKKSAHDKFKCTFRVAELYLNKAEALAELNEQALAETTLLALAEYRYTTQGLEDYTATINGLSLEDLKIEILEERKRELAIEGHRWNDLRRTSQAQISKSFGGEIFILEQQDARYVIPFPKDAQISNPNL
ncbi:MAG: RagB/SusD family nutrient uptake outer membrane protein [Flavobacteriaceae bacterium]|nr:MAG: RagB/SusD family nutrient uptake outer membrane protein [Flavobacteriaceae bacterium]